MNVKEISTKFGNFNIERYPALKNDSLQGFDSSDEYILNYIHENNFVSEDENCNVLVLNDSFGAVSISLSSYCKKIFSITDSYQAKTGCQNNISTNNISEDKVIYFDSLFKEDDIKTFSENNFDIIAIKIPKSSALLEFQLQSIASLMENSNNENIKIIGFGKAKNIHTSTLKLFEDIIGETKTSLAVKKSRLIFSEYNKDNKSYKSTEKFPVNYTIKNNNLFPDDDIKMINHCNLFSARKLDFGTTFLLENFPKLEINEEETCKVVDFGCGNGIISLFLAKKYPENQDMNLILIDESSMAIDSAIQSFDKNEEEETISKRCEFVNGSNFEKLENDSVDYIVSNPPFHQEFAINQEITQNMLEDAYRVLKAGGEIIIVANRHLKYHGKIQKVFGNYKNVASNPKFVVLSAKKVNIMDLLIL